MPNATAFALNIGAALLMGMAIGLERQFRQHTAGLKTNALVCLGSALFVSLSTMMDHESSETRIAAQVVSGIGFLAGGVILREGFNVRGMNTAATLWCTAAIGTLAGAGRLAEAAIGTVSVLFLHVALRPLIRRIAVQTKATIEIETPYRVRVVCDAEQSGLIRSILLRHINSHPVMTVQGIATQDAEQTGKSAIVANVFSPQRNDKYMDELISRLSIEPSVSAASWEKSP